MDIKRHAHIYDDLLKLDIILNFHDIPSPSYIQETLIQCNSFQLKTERFFIEVTRDLSTAERMFTTEKLNVSAQRMSILTNNKKVKALPTGKEREAAADEILEDTHRNLLKLENNVNDLKSILSAIKQKQTTLRGTNSDIKSLIKLMEQQVTRMNIGHPDDPDVKELAMTFSEIDNMEDEFNVDDIESSIEISQSEDSDKIIEEESVKPIISDDLEESVALEESVIIDESIVIMDELESDPITDGQVDSDQITEDIGEITKIPATSKKDESPSESESKDTPNEDSQDELSIEDELASLLTEDESDVFQSEDSNKDEDEQTPIIDEPAVENDSVADTGDSIVALDITIDDEINLNSDVESRVSEPPKLDVDLSDLGIVLDMGDDIPASAEETLSTNEVKPTNETGSIEDKAIKEDPPVQKKPIDTDKGTIKKEIVDIDLDDILNSI